MKCDEGVGSTYHTQIPETLQVIPVPLVSAHSQHDNSPNVHVKRESNKVLAVKRAEVPNANHELCVMSARRQFTSCVQGSSTHTHLGSQVHRCRLGLAMWTALSDNHSKQRSKPSRNSCNYWIQSIS